MSSIIEINAVESAGLRSYFYAYANKRDFTTFNILQSTFST